MISFTEVDCDSLLDFYRSVVIDFTEKYISSYKKWRFLVHIIFLSFLSPLFVSDFSLISKLQIIGVYAIIIAVLHYISMRNLREFENILDSIKRNDIWAAKNTILTTSPFQHLRDLYVLLAEENIRGAIELMNSFSFKFNVDWNTFNKDFKIAIENLRRKLPSCL